MLWRTPLKAENRVNAHSCLLLPQSRCIVHLRTPADALRVRMCPQGCAVPYSAECGIMCCGHAASRALAECASTTRTTDC